MSAEVVELVSDCMCEWDSACSGTGVIHCLGCGGDQCVCVCGGEADCPGCEACEGSDAPGDDGS